MMRRTICLGLILTCLLATVGRARAEADIAITIGTAKVVAVKSPERTAIGNPLIADVKQVSDTELLVTGKSLGSTTLTVWYANGHKQIYTVFVGAGRSGQTMVQVDVQVMEINTNDSKNLGLDWARMVGANGELFLRETTSPLEAIGTLERGKLNLFLRLLVEKGRGKVLARPKLLTLSGHKASFSSGGEVPVSVIGTSGQQSVEWKKFGVNLDVQPTARESGEINLEIRAEVSDADFSRLVNGNPTLKTRWAATTIQVQPGATVVIGGLIQDKRTVRSQGLPVLSEIPVLGYFFKSTEVTEEESELVIFVTPSIVVQGDSK